MERLFEVVEFRDNTSVTVTERNWETDARIVALETEAEQNPLEDQQRQFFHLYVYPKLAACSTGDVPSEEDAYDMPSGEREKWWDAAKRVNPKWFAPMEEAAEKITAEMLKKKETRRTKSMPASEKS